MYQIEYTRRFEKDLKRCVRRGLNMRLIYEAVRILQTTGMLPSSYKPHKLKGNRRRQWECHIQPDWLMTWEQDNDHLKLLFLQTGTHSDLF